MRSNRDKLKCTPCNSYGQARKVENYIKPNEEKKVYSILEAVF